MSADRLQSAKKVVDQREWILRRLVELRARAERIEIMASELPSLHSQIEQLEQRLQRPSPTAVPRHQARVGWSRGKDAGLNRVVRWAEVVDVNHFGVIDVERELGYSRTSANRIVREAVRRGVFIKLRPGAYVLAERATPSAATDSPQPVAADGP